MDAIATLITFLISFGLGYYVASRTPKEVESDVKKTAKGVWTRINPPQLGAIPDPTQKDIDRWNNPKRAAAEDEMNKTLKDLGVKKEYL